MEAIRDAHRQEHARHGISLQIMGVEDPELAAARVLVVDEAHQPALVLRLGAGARDVDKLTAAAAAAEGVLAAPVQPDTPPENVPVVKSEWDKTPRNAPCPCGSGKKFKLCHGQ